jgi:predicted acetyltransferase
MSLNLRWVGAEEIDRVAEARMLSYATSRRERATYQQGIRAEVRSGPGDWLLAEQDGEVVGTATSLPLKLWVRGGSIKCQGVAFVGTVKTARRKGSAEPGVGTAVMNETLRMAKDHGFVVSALMPFRGTYYEHFGYGFVERRAEWKIPLDLIPRHDFSSVRFYRDSDFDELVKCRNRIAQTGQCDIERSPEMWQYYLKLEHGFLVVDRDGDGPVRGWMNFDDQHADGLDTVRAYFDTGYEDIHGLKRLLSFLGSLRDQYRFASIQLPADVRLNLLLKEKQMTHRVSKNYSNAEVRSFNRMQMRILDHPKFLTAIAWPATLTGKVVVAVQEPNTAIAKFEVDVADGKANVKSTDASADLECSDPEWAMIACGDLSASAAAKLGLVQLNNPKAAAVLDALSEGTPPYCREYF